MSCSNRETQRTTERFGFEDKKICCCGERFTFNLTQTSNDRYTLTVTPCSLPTAVFDIATIAVKTNTCNQIEYYQVAINTDPVEIIQECDLECAVCRAITTYFNNATLPTCNNRRNSFLF